MKFLALLLFLTSTVQAESLYFQLDKENSSESCSPYAYRYAVDRDAGEWHALLFFTFKNAYLKINSEVDGFLGEERSKDIGRRGESVSIRVDEESGSTIYEKSAQIKNRRSRLIGIGSIKAEISKDGQLTALIKRRSISFNCKYLPRTI